MAGFTVEQLTAIESAIASGELVVQYNGKRVEYRSMADLVAARNLMRGDLLASGALAAPAGRGSTTVTSYHSD